MLVKLLLIVFGVFVVVMTTTRYPALENYSVENLSKSIPQAVATTTLKKSLEIIPTKKLEIPKKNTLPKIPTKNSKEVKQVINTSDESTSTVSLNPLPPADFDSINKKAREATINILCTSRNGGLFDPLSGSGVIIDPRGIVLTTAHIAQYLLLEKYHGKDFLNCIARTGSPANPAYTIKLLYISTKWVNDNYKDITSQHQIGTGENDYALLQIASGTDPLIKIPANFPFVPIDSNEDNIKTGNPVVLVGYPAGFLGGIAIQRDLYLVSSIITLGQLFTFGEGTVDAVSLGGSVVAQHGSSGGGVVSTEGKLQGIIVTSTDGKETANRDLTAITISHINRSMGSETYLTLSSLLSSDLEIFSQKFNTETLPKLEKIVADEIDSKNP